jgi:heme A synthase
MDSRKKLMLIFVVLAVLAVIVYFVAFSGSVTSVTPPGDSDTAPGLSTQSGAN